MADLHNSATAEADADANAYQRGSMEINEQSATFGLFMRLAKWGSLAVAVIVLFLTLWFNPAGSFVAAVIGSVVLAVIGVFALKSKGGSDH